MVLMAKSKKDGKKGVPKRDGSGKGVGENKGRGGCPVSKQKSKLRGRR